MEKQILLIVDLFCSYRVANWSFTFEFSTSCYGLSKDFHTRLCNALIRKGMWARNADNGKLQILNTVWRWHWGKKLSCDGREFAA